MPARKYRRDTSEVSCCLKYVIFGFNVLFWWLGLGIMAVGVWAWKEKETFSNLSRLTNVALDPAFILILVGTITSVIGFTGCVGALRENTCLLATYAIFLGTLLLLEMTIGVLGFIFKDWIKSQATGGFQAFIIHYRDDPDQQNLIDWIQEDWLQCCGIEGPKDWDRNNYFNCSSSEIGSSEACGVPFSCCKREPNEITKNKQCGYNVRKPGNPGERSIFERGCLRAGEEWLELNLVPVAGTIVSTMVLQTSDVSIYEKGCIQAGEEWMEKNLLVIATTAIITAFAQILGICFAQNLRADIFAQKAKWH
ncbi:tetraspanin-17 isoform X3 [Cotesia glomerata]|uniref:tetraspanin-17 isoform X3 n=1 Tax=Cotesia glomerata TaxID=32391 RepID=UPI001D02B1C3|nr:tetraspanin-17 isoform X3 [Cotesia glomerata]